MIALTTQDGRALRLIDAEDSGVIGWHRTFGFVSVKAAAQRNTTRLRRGAAAVELGPDQWDCQFRVMAGRPLAIARCEVAERDDGVWHLDTPRGLFYLTPAAALAAESIPLGRSNAFSEIAPLLLTVLTIAALIALGLNGKISVPLTAPEAPIAEAQKTVAIPEVKVAAAPEAVTKAPDVSKAQAQAATVKSKLGFLSLAGKTGGGTPVPSERRTPGAGGNRADAGELLSAIGQGVKPTTVGNSGVRGLGGFGKGYEGAGSIAGAVLAKEVELEGGLDRNVVQATIAKYLSQVRACYERGLRRVPGLTGQVTMDFQIAASGRLSFAKVKSTTLGQPEVESCIANVMLTWQFPKPVGGVAVSVNYPFLLKPANYM